MFTLAHLSDPHLPPLPKPRLAELANKRVLGYLHWRQSRHRIHRAEQVDLLVRDLHAQAPDHVAVTGDLVNIGLVAEFAPARVWLQSLGRPHEVTLVPGNHDAYLRQSLAAHGHWADFMSDDAANSSELRFPFVRRRGPLALIGLSSAVPTAPFLATGRLGAAQLARLDELLGRLADCCRVVLVHHPPGRTRVRRFRSLTDAPALRAVLARRGAELVLHGHDHVLALDWLTGPNVPIPALGVPSASAMPLHGHRVEPAAYNLYRIDGVPGAWRREVVTRGFRAGAPGVVELARRELNPSTASPAG
ncbi:MAG TPA: metallophosphoesterase [Xanthobacteraceae bacterium]|nr:metallophosphoesterase [Xanthobacteraceae bacterium]